MEKLKAKAAANKVHETTNWIISHTPRFLYVFYMFPTIKGKLNKDTENTFLKAFDIYRLGLVEETRGPQSVSLLTESRGRFKSIEQTDPAIG